jgi:Tol biopolymer transport system component
MRFSPDGDFIAYDFIQQNGSFQRDINLLARDGSLETSLVQHPSNDIFLGWMPDGKSILLASDRSGVLGAWCLQVQNGSPQGTPSLVKADIGPLHSLGFTTDGSFYYGIMSQSNNVAIVEIDPVSGIIVDHQEKAIWEFEGNNQTPAYSPDGKYLAYVRRFPLSPRLSILPGGNILCIRNQETGKERELRTTLHRFGWPSWSPDGKSVLVVSWDANDQMSYVQIDVQTGMEKTVVKPGKDFSLFGGHAWSKNGKTVYYGLRDKKANSWNIMSRELASGKEEIIFQSPEFYNFDLSPDGKSLALCFLGGAKNAHVNIFSISDGELRELCSFDQKARIGGNSSLSWTVNGKYILFALCEDPSANRVFQLCRIPASGGDLEKLELEIENVFVNLNAHPDGRHFAYSTLGNRITEIWVMENIVHEAQAVQIP